MQSGLIRGRMGQRSLSFQVSHQVGLKTHLNATLHSNLHFERKRGEIERWCHISAGYERVQALSGEERTTMLGESDRERKTHDT
jgi:hypothetical protein